MKDLLKNLKWRLFHIWLSLRIREIRKKKQIRFGFLLQELSQWKSESLFKAMRTHPRFDPILCISPCLEFPGAENRLIEYCKKNGYAYFLLDPGRTIGEQLDVDIVMPEKPYKTQIHPLHQIEKNKRIPYVAMTYFLSTITEEWVVNQRLYLLCWRQFLDTESCRKEWSNIHRLKGLNYEVTGLPVMDELLTPREDLPDVWPVHDGRLRIIYAPHHTISNLHLEGIAYSTFLDYCDAMLELRDKYKEKVYFVFKPHPSLRRKLVKLWGEEPTEQYYQKWNEPGTSHVEEGAYLSLFKYSDAMVHDCGSFTVEYMYMDRPVMYLVRDDTHADNMIPYAKEAFDLHYKGRNRDDIERFIQDVIAGNDPLREKRAEFKQRNLLPPNGRTACDNILHSILGE